MDGWIRKETETVTHVTERNGVVLLTFPALDRLGMVRAGFSTRHGGVSTGHLAEMNFSFGQGEPEEVVRENYRRAASALGVAPGLAEGFVALECEPVTGRTHQIRATVRALGLEVAGDKLYGPDRAIYARLCAGAMTPADRAALGLSRQALHAWRLDFREPATGLPRSVTAPPDALLAEFSAWRAM